MKGEAIIQGRIVSAADVEQIRELRRLYPDWSRRKLSLELCKKWNWCNLVGQLKDIACRDLLRKLEARGEISLPPAKHGGNSRRLNNIIKPCEYSTALIECDLKSIQPITVKIIKRGVEQDLWRAIVSKHHYLGFRTSAGQNISYLAYDQLGNVVGCLLFGAAAWKCAARDKFTGWSPELRKTNLHRIANNMRFLIPPWVRVKHLASFLLGAVARRISADWENTYGHPIDLLETFVEKQRFEGTCYRAANWIYVGETTGRTRKDVNNTIKAPIKDVYVYTLNKSFRRNLLEV